jgi:SNF2 family DNA or RNA helicase
MLFHIDVYDGNTFLLVANGWQPEFYELCKEFPERKWVNNKSNGIKGWAVPVTSSNIEYLNRHWKEKLDYSISDQAKALLKYEKLTLLVDELKAHKRWEYLFEAKPPEFDYPYVLKPFAHQVVSVEAAYGSEAFGWLMEMGTGKTKCAIDETMLYGMGLKEDEMLRICVVCPKSLIVNWEREFHKNYPQDLLNYKIACLNKGDLKSIESIVGLFNDPAPIKICIVSQDSVATQIKQLMMFKPTIIIFDESHYLKNPGTQRWKACMKLADNSSMRRILTGTPISNNIMDVWAQFELLRKGCLGYATYSGYKAAYAEVNDWCGHETVTGYREDNVGKLKENMAKCSFIVKKDQCLDLPAKMYDTVEVEMPEAMRGIYDKFASEFAVELNDGASVSTEHIIVQMLKLSQICSGFVSAVRSVENGEDPEGESIKTASLEYIPGGDAKLDIMLDRAEDVMREGKLIIWSRFKLDNEVIYRRLTQRGFLGGKYDSTTSDAERQRIIDGFTNNDNFRFFVGSQRAGGVGLTLLGTPNVRVHNVFYYSNDFNFGAREQSEDRAHRIGLKNPVLYTDFAYADSIESYIAKRLQTKKDLATMVKNVGEIKELLLKGRAA